MNLSSVSSVLHRRLGVCIASNLCPSAACCYVVAVRLHACEAEVQACTGHLCLIPGLHMQAIYLVRVHYAPEDGMGVSFDLRWLVCSTEGSGPLIRPAATADKHTGMHACALLVATHMACGLQFQRVQAEQRCPGYRVDCDGSHAAGRATHSADSHTTPQRQTEQQGMHLSTCNQPIYSTVRNTAVILPDLGFFSHALSLLTCLWHGCKHAEAP